MEFKKQEALDGKVIIIEVPDRLDIHVAPDFRAKLSELVEQGNYQIIFDLGNTAYVDSLGLSALVSRIAEARSNQGDIRFASPSGFFRELLVLTHLNQVIKIFDDVNSALDSFRQV